MTDRPRRSIIACGVLLVAGVGVFAEWLGNGTRLDFAAQRDLFTGWAIAGSGLVAWAAVPRSRIGPLLVAAGLAWFIWNASGTEPVDWLATALTDLCAGILAHALFTWPTGRAERPLERSLVAGGYIVALFPPLWERDISLLFVAALLAFGLIVQDRTLPAQERRVRRPVLVLGLGIAALLATKGAIAAALRAAGMAYPGGSSDLWQLGVVAVAVGLAWSLVALDRRRRGAADLVVRLGEEQPSMSATQLAEAAGLTDDTEVREALAQATRMANRNAALRGELAAQVVALERSRRRLVEAADAERADLESRLRSGAVARLARLELSLEERRDGMASMGPEAASRVERAVEQLRRAQQELSELAAGLDPGLLRERGLDPALRDLATGSPVPVGISLRLTDTVDPSVARTLFYVASEALANVAKHARAAHAWLWVDARPGELALAVEDDGVGVGERQAGSGLTGLRDRLDAMGGTLDISERPGGGTRLTAIVPTASDSAPA
jgi:signal transduction histidine kinase